MFIFMFFFFTFFSSIFFATGTTQTTVKPVLGLLQKDACYLKSLKDQYQKIKNNNEILEEVSRFCEQNYLSHISIPTK